MQKKNEVDQNIELLESFHLAGACTLMYPVWGILDPKSGISTAESLAQLLILFKIYILLPSMRGRNDCVAYAVRAASLWLRNILYSPDRGVLFDEVIILFNKFR